MSSDIKFLLNLALDSGRDMSKVECNRILDIIEDLFPEQMATNGVVAATQTGAQIDGEDLDDLIDGEINTLEHELMTGERYG